MALPLFLDFETEAIGRRPIHYPPLPYSCATLYGDKELYWTDLQALVSYVRELVRDGAPVVCHNAKFDIEILASLGVTVPSSQIEDTMILLYLLNPRAKSYALKTAHSKIFGKVPDERNTLQQAVMRAFPKVRAEDWGAWISHMPHSLVKPYALADVRLTSELYSVVKSEVVELGMETAYRREMSLIPIILNMEVTGVRIDTDLLAQYIGQTEIEVSRLRNLLYKKLHVEINLDSDLQLAKALENAGLVSGWETTKTGKKSTKRLSLEKHISDPEFMELWTRYSKLTKLVTSYFIPWSQLVQDGILYPNWNSTRDTDKKNGLGVGTRTGRLSSDDPSFQVIPNKDKVDPSLPDLRKLVLPDNEYSSFVDLDYSQQEYRILAHYAGGNILWEYQQNPEIDFHEKVKQILEAKTGCAWDRKKVKTINFGILYGMGNEKLANALGITEEEAKGIKLDYRAGLPEVEALNRNLKDAWRRDLSLRTWGGRLYWPEEATVKDGKVRSYDYKALNTLIQGSAADIMKEAMVRSVEALGGHNACLRISLHDQMLFSIPDDIVEESYRSIKEAMESVPLDAKLLVTGGISKTWGG